MVPLPPGRGHLWEVRMSTYVTVEDVRARWDGDASTERVQAFLDDAEAILAARIPDLADRLTAGSTSAAMLRIVLVRAVTRYLNNPQGYVGEHAGEVGYYYAQGAKNAPAGQVAFTEADLTDLGLDFSSRARSVRLAVPAQWSGGGHPWPRRDCW